ncbi:MAG: hypothetical protein K5840_02125 [Eubacterium sp.]|nr:hypothetical protein [Eubacterium sp.]
MAEWLIGLPPAARYLDMKDGYGSESMVVMRKLCPRGGAANELRTGRVGDVAMILRVLTAAAVLALAAGVYESGVSVLSSGDTLLRNNAGEGSYTASLNAYFMDEVMEVEVPVAEVVLEGGEEDALFERALQELESTYLGDNAAADEVRSPLRLVNSVADGLVDIEWNISDYSVLRSDGSINSENVVDEGSPVTLLAKMTYEESQVEHSFGVTVYPPELTEEERRAGALSDALSRADEETSTQDEYVLPTEVDGQQVSWSAPGSHMALKVLAFGLVVAVLLGMRSREELKNREKKRDEQLLADYAGIVDKLALFLGAGMTIRGAWEKTALEYEEKLAGGKIGKRYAYEEMAVGMYRMREGESESHVYEDFGIRCGLRQYRKLATLITQNLRLGTAGLTKLLEAEESEAFEERKALARKKAEEAATRLIVPMVLLMMVVIVIVVFPGFMSFHMGVG